MTVIQICLAKGAKVYIACRSAEKAHETITELQNETGRMDIHFLPLDLADMKNIKASAEEFSRYGGRFGLLGNVPDTWV